MTFADLHDRCVVPQMFTVCGVELPPMRFAIARTLMTTGFMNPCTWNALRAGVLIASQPVPALPVLIAMIRFGEHDRRIDRWMVSAMKRYKLADECLAFASFVRYWIEPPESLRNKDRTDARPPAMPFIQHLRAVLLSHLNYSPDSIDAALYAQCLMDYYSWAETEGILRVLSLSGDERRELLKEGWTE